MYGKNSYPHAKCSTARSSVPKSLKIRELFHDFGLPLDEFKSLFPVYAYEPENKIGTLSGGEVRILETYIVLRAQSMFSILDEPFSQIMPIHVDVIKKLIMEEKEHKGILISDHMYRNVLDISDLVYVINERTTYQAHGEEDLIRHGYIR